MPQREKIHNSRWNYHRKRDLSIYLTHSSPHQLSNPTPSPSAPKRIHLPPPHPQTNTTPPKKPHLPNPNPPQTSPNTLQHPQYQPPLLINPTSFLQTHPPHIKPPSPTIS